MARLASRSSVLAARRRRRPPPRAQRLARTPKPPKGAELAYRIAVRQLVAAYAAKVRRTLLGRLDDFAFRSDAEVPEAVLDSLSAAVKIDTEPFISSLNQVAAKALSFSKSEFKRIGIQVRKEPNLGKAIDFWRKENVKRVTSLFDHETKVLEKILRESEGRTPKQLADRIEERIEVTRSKAEFLARDQTLSLNGQITRDRQASAGIEEFIWTTSGDERVRESHRALDGKRFRWDDPPIVDGRAVIPGDDYQCRCTAFPVLPELED